VPGNTVSYGGHDRKRRGRRSNDDVADVQSRYAGDNERCDEIRLDGLGEQPRLPGADVDDDTALLTDDSVRQGNHRRYDHLESFPSAAGDDD